MKQAEIYGLALDKWGVSCQLATLIEEAAELQQAMAKILRGEPAHEVNLEEEVADVEIMLGQLRVIWPHLEECVQYWKRKKKRRLLQRIREPELFEEPKGEQ